MSDKDIFSQNADGNSQEGTQDQDKHDPFAELVGEDKRYKSPQELAKGKQEADAFIEQMKEENAQLREDLNKRLTAEEILAQVKAASKDAGTNTPSISEEEIAKLVKGTVQEMDTQKSAQSNLDISTKMVTDKYGDKAPEVIVAKARELGLTPQDLQATAMQSPQAFKRLMGLETASSNQSGSMEGSVNNQAFDNQSGGHNGPEAHTYAWYEKLRKENPREYFSPQVQNQMFLKRKELGDKFFN